MIVRSWGSPGKPVVVLGEFDGYHLGHRQLVHQAGAMAARLGRPLIGAVLVDESAATMLTTVDERCWALLASGASGAHAVSVLASGDVHLAAALVDELVTRLDPSVVVMACLPGTTTSARYPSLRAELERRAVHLVEVPRWKDPDGQDVTSDRVRTALRQGDIVAANDWMGRTFTLTGVVVPGSGLGRTIGFPTANLDLPAHRIVPMHGVYAGTVTLSSGERHRAAINIGVRPTVETAGALLVEAHLLDFDADLYGQSIDVGFRRWLRHEHRFDSVDALVAQLGVDVEQTRLLLRGAPGAQW